MVRKFLLAIAVPLLLLSACTQSNRLESQGFMKSPDGLWQTHAGPSVKIQDGVVMGSIDGQSWDPIQAWEAEDGKAYKFDGQNVLFVSSDVGKTWTEAPDQTWPGKDGKIYGLDEQGTLWWKSTSAAVPDQPGSAASSASSTAGSTK